MWASKLFVVVVAIAVTVRAKPLLGPWMDSSSFAEDTASEIKHIKEAVQEFKDHPNAKNGDEIKALIDEVKTLKDNVIEKKKEEEIEKANDEKKEVLKEDVKVEVVVEGSEHSVIADYKTQIQKIRNVLEDPKTAKNENLMAILKDDAKRIQFEVQQKIKAINEKKKKKDAIPEVIAPKKDVEEKKEEAIHKEEDEQKKNTKIYIGNLDSGATDHDLRFVFEKCGNILEIEIPTDRDTGRAKGYAFVTMEKQEEAQCAIDQGNGADIRGREVTVNIAKDRVGRVRSRW